MKIRGKGQICDSVVLVCILEMAEGINTQYGSCLGNPIYFFLNPVLHNK